MSKPIIAEIIPPEIIFKPNAVKPSFKVKVINNSDQLANFQIDIKAAGAEQFSAQWYMLSPEISTKKPPGDITEFVVTIFQIPVSGFVGTMNLIVRIFSIELAHEERVIVRLKVLGALEQPIKVGLPVKEFTTYPGTQFNVPVQLYNPTKVNQKVILRCLGLEPTWFIESMEQEVELLPETQFEGVYKCLVPSTTQVISQSVPFEIEAVTEKKFITRLKANLIILPYGVIKFSVTPQSRKVPHKYFQQWPWKFYTQSFSLEFENRSNLAQVCSAKITANKHILHELIPPEELTNPSEYQTINLDTKVKRHWFGPVRKYSINIETVLSDTRLGETKPNNAQVDLKVSSIVPTALIVWLLILLLLIALWLSWINPYSPIFGHKFSVNSVALNEIVTRVISGSNDQTIREWSSGSFLYHPIINPEIKIVGDSKKSVRVVKYRPLGNNIIAAGLENGEVQIWSLIENNQRETFSYQRDDRVFALEYTLDSKTLFSGHGSGLVLKWDVEYVPEGKSQAILKQEKKFDFAVYALKLMDNEKKMIVAGRFNQLYIWDYLNNKIESINYRKGGKDDYIFALDAPFYKPNMLVTGDNQGFITIWNMNSCLLENKPCEIIDQWSDGHREKSVRTVSFTPDGCYIASGGDDGRIMLWPLAYSGKRAIGYSDGIIIGYSNYAKSINSVSAKLHDKQVFIASGSDDTKVRVHESPRLPNLGCDR